MLLVVPVGEGAVCACCARGEEGGRYRSSLDLRSELEAATHLPRLESDGHLRKLAGASALLLVGVLDVGWPRNGLAVINLGRSHLASDAELSLEPVHNDILHPAMLTMKRSNDLLSY